MYNILLWIQFVIRISETHSKKNKKCFFHFSNITIPPLEYKRYKIILHMMRLFYATIIHTFVFGVFTEIPTYTHTPPLV